MNTIFLDGKGTFWSKGLTNLLPMDCTARWRAQQPVGDGRFISAQRLLVVFMKLQNNRDSAYSAITKFL